MRYNCAMQFLFIPLALVFGLLLGAGVAIGMFVNLSEAGNDWLNKWQTLVSGILALVAGGLTVGGIVWQVQRQLAAEADHKAEEHARKRLATRAVLPSDLTEVCNFTHQCARIARQAYRRLTRGESGDRWSLGELPPRILDNLRMVIEFLNEEEAHVVADLLDVYQVHLARMRGFMAKYGDGGHIDVDDVEHLYYAMVELRVRADAVFDFARREVDVLKPPSFEAESVRAALNVLNLRDDGMTDDFRTRLSDLLVRRGARMQQRAPA